MRLDSLSLIPFAVLAACGPSSSSGTPPATPGGATTSATAPAAGTPNEQVSTGAKSYAEACSSCHGAKGEGSKAPSLVGGKSMNDYKNAAELFQYTKDNMPQQKPGSLSDVQYWEITAFLVNANGVDLGGKKLDASTGKDIPSHK